MGAQSFSPLWILDLPDTASVEEIKARRKVLLARLQPDRNPGCGNLFKLVNSAADIAMRRATGAIEPPVETPPASPAPIQPTEDTLDAIVRTFGLEPLQAGLNAARAKLRENLRRRQRRPRQ